jgi:hypothetical protein
MFLFYYLIWIIPILLMLSTIILIMSSPSNDATSIILLLLAIVASIFLFYESKTMPYGSERMVWFLIINGIFALLSIVFSVISFNDLEEEFGWFYIVLLVLSLLCEINLGGRLHYLNSQIEAPTETVQSRPDTPELYLGKDIARLEKKIQDLAILREKLEKKKSGVVNSKEIFSEEIQNHEIELLSGCEENNSCGTSYEQAMKDTNIRDIVMLIQKKKAYRDKLEDIEYQLAKAIQETNTLEANVKADMLLIRTVGGKDTAALVDEINRVVKQYSPFTKQQYAINPKELDLERPEEIWDNLTAGNGDKKSEE